jgi:mRNA interferase RelE/StbE
MDYYNLRFKSSALKELKIFPPAIIKKIINAISDLKENPFPAEHKKLIGNKPNYRIRVGNYRIIYDISFKEKIITINCIKHRKDVYRK